MIALVDNILMWLESNKDELKSIKYYNNIDLFEGCNVKRAPGAEKYFKQERDDTFATGLYFILMHDNFVKSVA